MEATGITFTQAFNAYIRMIGEVYKNVSDEEREKMKITFKQAKRTSDNTIRRMMRKGKKEQLEEYVNSLTKEEKKMLKSILNRAL